MSDDQENLDQDAMADEWAAALAEQDDTGGGDGQAEAATQVHKPELDQFESGTVPRLYVKHPHFDGQL